MGLYQHDAVVAVAWDSDEVVELKEWISGMSIPDFPCLIDEMFQIVEMPMGGMISVTLIPDGSKERWDVSGMGDVLRAAFIEWLKGRVEIWDWVSVSFGEAGQRITGGNCDD